jgi:L-lactate dehydrogenase complex protein LldG
VADSRRAILGVLGVGPVPEAPPTYRGPRVRFDDPIVAFREALEAAGGSLVVFSGAAALEAARADLPRDTVVLQGGPAVAESGAVWWVPRDTEARREAFLAERVVVVVDGADVVDDLHTAYGRIAPAAAPFGCFVSGPSKTADIEQALVIGAHGPRELAVWLQAAGLEDDPARNS